MYVCMLAAPPTPDTGWVSVCVQARSQKSNKEEAIPSPYPPFPFFFLTSPTLPFHLPFSSLLSLPFKSRTSPLIAAMGSIWGSGQAPPASPGRAWPPNAFGASLTDVAWLVGVSVCLCVGHNCKTAARIEMPFELWTQVSQRNHVLGDVPDPPAE